MRVGFDTSVVVAGLVRTHPHHRRSVVWLHAAREGNLRGILPGHVLAESWATLTAMPLHPSLTTIQVREMLWRVQSFCEVIPVQIEDYSTAMAACEQAGVRSGALYDALHYAVAERAACSYFVTFNEKDFTRFYVPSGPKIRVPPAPPSIDI